MLVELGLVEQRLKAVHEELDGASVVDVAQRYGVVRQTVNMWLKNLATAEMAGLVDNGSRPEGCPHRPPAVMEARIIRKLRAATGDVLIPDFDRIEDEPRPDRIRLRSSDHIIIVEGNYLLLDRDPWSTLRDCLDAVGYVDISPEVRIARLIARHVEFGKTPEAAATFVRESDERNTKIIEAARGRSDLFIEDSP